MNMQPLPTVEELLWSWPAVCKAAKDEWAKDFALSIAKQSRHKNWTPSTKQHALMMRMVNEVYRHRGDFDGRDDFPLIED
ncbi:DUF664 domain-containing protein [Paracoccus sediminis]|uniref:DUF664 domain-containing protein n=1 Tax=Paracoccus sediminis TaxID=1214787 RepID=A0A238XKK4_9RHOB|nr:DUF664 domain-containing protein [Paracoccus sediminis]TBN48564.1 DUF664 domain-containing protein [Paracoccus sediminis]SNR59098.1 Protein of unknown function [Paracoccus sediminis]